MTAQMHILTVVKKNVSAHTSTEKQNVDCSLVGMINNPASRLSALQRLNHRCDVLQEKIAAKQHKLDTKETLHHCLNPVASISSNPR